MAIAELTIKIKGDRVTVRTRVSAKVPVSTQDAAARKALPGAKLALRSETMHDGKPVESLRTYRA